MTAHDTEFSRLARARTAPVTEVLPRRREKPQIYRHGMKRVLDVVLVLLSAPIVLPLVFMLALLVARDGGRPFYSQERIGKNGRVYRMWKMRSMVHDADSRLRAYLDENEAMRAEWESKQKLIDDPRITRLGQVLRKTSLDELPQLWNVLKGDMSIVGPRPMMVNQKALYPGSDYYDLRPGITGAWQISDRNASTFAERARFDASYNETLSFTKDVRILGATVRVVMKATGY